VIWLLALLGATTPEEAGAQAFEAGDYAQSLVQWSVALDQARDLGDVDAQDALLLRLSSSYRHLGRLDEAGATLDLVQVDGPRVDIGRGLIELEQGQLRQAEKSFSQAFRDAQSAQDAGAAADAALDLGLARLHQGRLEEASKAFVGAESLFRALELPVGQADALTNLGVAERRAAQLGLAQEHLEAAVGLYRAVDHRAGEADALTNLGLVLQQQGRHEQAVELYQAALGTARSRKDLARQGLLLQNLATLDQASGRLREAEERYLLAEQAYLAAGLQRDAISVAIDLATLRGDAAQMDLAAQGARKAGHLDLQAIALLNAGVLQDDDERLGQALRLAEKQGQTELIWRARAQLGMNALDRGEPGGLDLLRQAVDELERSRSGLDEQASQSFVLTHEPVYQRLVQALLAQGDSLGAFVYAERLQLASLPTSPAPDSEELRVYRQLQQEQSWVAERLAQVAPDTEQALELRARLAELHVEFAGTVDELRAANPEFDQLVRVDPEDLEAVQRDLEPGVVVIQPLLLESELVILLVAHDRLKVHRVEVDPDKVQKTTSRLTRSLRAQMIDDVAWTDGLADQLGSWLIAPIAEDLVGARVLVVSATGTFQQLPFALLRHEGRYLAQDLAVANVTHVGSLRAHGALQPRFHLRAEELLLVGNPDGSLPEAEDEVRAIARGWPGSTLIVGSLGRELLQEQVGHKSTVHLATHGVIDPRQPDRSYLVVGDSGQPGGRLSYREIPGLAPYLDEARMVVLSACESGLPVKAPEAEGSELAVSINGLSAQFRRAGVETLVASLWKVDDLGTRRLMEGFYANLARGEDVATAMQHSQQALIEDPELHHPWFWASFVVLGDWR
jgi:CHAT domain-containing protein